MTFKRPTHGSGPNDEVRDVDRELADQLGHGLLASPAQLTGEEDLTRGREVDCRVRADAVRARDVFEQG